MQKWCSVHLGFHWANGIQEYIVEKQNQRPESLALLLLTCGLLALLLSIQSYVAHHARLEGMLSAVSFAAVGSQPVHSPWISMLEPSVPPPVPVPRAGCARATCFDGSNFSGPGLSCGTLASHRGSRTSRAALCCFSCPCSHPLGCCSSQNPSPWCVSEARLHVWGRTDD